VDSIAFVTVAIWLAAFMVFILAWRYRATLKTHWFHKIVHWSVLVGISLAITAVAAGLIYGQNTPPDHAPIAWPYDFLMIPALTLLFFAVFLTFVYDQSRTRKNGILTLIFWSGLVIYCSGLWALSHL